MSAGDNVYKNLGAIIQYCEKIDHNELERLCNFDYSKKTFKLNFSFFIDVNDIDESNKKKQSKRFLSSVYIVRGKKVRVTSQWPYSSIPYFYEYLKNKNIQPIVLIKDYDTNKQVKNSNKKTSARINSRFRGNAIGSAQNSLIRNILSNLGNESFNEEAWFDTKRYFNNKCAYCGSDEELLIEHAIPINREKLGEHKLGNIIPSCKKCNSEKGEKDYREYLGERFDQIKNIEAYMDSKNYVPLENDEQLKNILNMAYEEVANVADRYIRIINELFL